MDFMCSGRGKRAPPNGYPLPYVAGLYKMLESTIYVAYLEVEKILGLAVAVTNIEAFLATADGCAFFEKNCTVLRAPAGTWLFLPNGFFAYFLNHPPVQGPEEAKTAKKEVHTSCFLCIPLLVESWVQDLPPTTLSAIKTVNQEVFVRKAGVAMYASRADIFAQVFGD